MLVFLSSCVASSTKLSRIRPKLVDGDHTGPCMRKRFVRRDVGVRMSPPAVAFPLLLMLRTPLPSPTCCHVCRHHSFAAGTSQGVSSVLDEASRRVDSKPKANDNPSVENQDQYSTAASTSTSRQHDRSSYLYDGQAPSAALGSPAGDTSGNQEKVEQSYGVPSASGEEKASKGSGKGAGRTANPDPINRVETVVRTSIAGSLRLVGAAVKGVGDAVFQAGAVAEGLAGGTGMVAGTSNYLSSGMINWFVDAMID